MARPSDAHEFYKQGMQELDHLLLGEKEAKLGVLVAMVMGENILYVGLPGGGKTTLGTDAYRLVEGIEEGRVAEIPPMADLPPSQLVGNEAETRKEITEHGITRTEVTKSAITPIIREDTQSIFTNEINRVNPFALNAGLEAFESGKIVTPSGVIYLKDLEYGVSTMNPAETRQAVFPMAAAMASRHALGAVLGNNSPVDRAQIIQTIAEGWKPSPELIRPATNLDILHELRDEVPHMPIPGDLMDDTIRLVAGTVDTLAGKGVGIHEADGRITKQITEIAKTLAILNAQDRVNKEQIHGAIKYVLGARLGALSANAAVQIPALHAEITGVR